MLTTTSPVAHWGDERIIGLSQASKLIPGRGANGLLHPATLTRWILRGCRSTSGRLVRLEAYRVGSRWVTSVEAIGRFVASLTDLPAPATDPTPAPVTPAARTRKAESASRDLDAALTSPRKRARKPA